MAVAWALQTCIATLHHDCVRRGTTAGYDILKNKKSKKNRQFLRARAAAARRDDAARADPEQRIASYYY